jgi:hypothetical protein
VIVAFALESREPSYQPQAINQESTPGLEPSKLMYQLPNEPNKLLKTKEWQN